MIKIICINNSMVEPHLTLHKVYEVEHIGNFYKVRNDEGNLREYSTKRFIPISELRERQIKSVLDD